VAADNAKAQANLIIAGQYSSVGPGKLAERHKDTAVAACAVRFRPPIPAPGQCWGEAANNVTLRGGMLIAWVSV
jgi:hypothetical protein